MAVTRSRREPAAEEVQDDAGSESEEDTLVPSQPSQSPTKSTGGISVGSASDDGTEDPTERCLAEDLGLRAPTYQETLKEVQRDRSVDKHFCHSRHHSKDGDRAFFFETEPAKKLWCEVAEKLKFAIIKYSPRRQKDIKEKVRRYEEKKRKIIDDYIGTYDLTGGKMDEVGAFDQPGDESRLFEMVTLQMCIGHSFVHHFHKLVTPRGGTKKVPLSEMISACVTEALGKSISDCFEPKVAPRVYYVGGFLCHAGAKEAQRRSDGNDVGECIESLNEHFASSSDEEQLAQIKRDLPVGVTQLVDSRCKLGGLKYINMSLFETFGLWEYVYSNLAIVSNLTMFGGSLLSQLCNGMLENEQVVSRFEKLFAEGEFSKETVKSTLEYYMKVFGNVRAKDLCYRLNSNLSKGPSVGLRQSVCGARATGKRKSKKEKKQEKKEKSRAKRQRKRTYESSDDEGEPAEYDDGDGSASDDEQHSELLKSAEEEINEDSDTKVCSNHDVIKGIEGGETALSEEDDSSH